MLESVFKTLRTAVRSGARFLALLFAAAQLSAQSTDRERAGSVRGTVYDSVHKAPLTGAVVELQPSGRETATNDLGEFRFDTVSASGGYRIRVVHPMLDTVGIVLVTPEFAVEAVQTSSLALAVPSPARLVALFCTPAWLARGPSALIGFIRDPDTGATIDSVTVSLVYDDNPIGLFKRPVNRVATPDAAGRYKICGLPAQVNGKVQLLRKGTQSAEIPVATDATSPLALRALGMSLSTQQVDGGRDSAGKAIRTLRGEATLTGRVVSKSGSPVAGARVQMDATTAAAVTATDGRFMLQGLPTGTQTLSVRKLGFTVTDKAVEVSMNSPQVVVVMADYIPTLAPVISIAQRDQDKQRIGFTRRKQSGMGIFREGDELSRGGNLVDVLSQLPGLRSQAGSIVSRRGPNSCLTIFVDGVVWQDIPGSGDISQFVQPNELQAVELYGATTVPAEFINSIQSSCQVLVMWTSRKIRPGTLRKP